MTNSIQAFQAILDLYTANAGLKPALGDNTYCQQNT